MPSHSEMARAQHTDDANSAPLIGARNAGDDLKQVSSKSAQVIALEPQGVQQSQTGSGGQNPGANVQAGK